MIALNEIILRIAACLAGYLIGGFPTGVLVGKLLHHRDIRKFGSGNPGAINIWRVFGLKWGLLVVALDAIKGYGVAALLPQIFQLGDLPHWAALLGLMAVMGHIWSPYIGFRGGKGVAAAFGAGLAAAPEATMICLAIWLLVVAVTRYASVASLLVAACYPVLLYWRGDPGPKGLTISLAVPLLLTWSHRSNLRRLRSGEELKVGHHGTLGVR